MLRNGQNRIPKIWVAKKPRMSLDHLNKSKNLEINMNWRHHQGTFLRLRPAVNEIFFTHTFIFEHPLIYNSSAFWQMRWKNYMHAKKHITYLSGGGAIFHQKTLGAVKNDHKPYMWHVTLKCLKCLSAAAAFCHARSHTRSTAAAALTQVKRNRMRNN
jgi:hypothetical protein